MTPEFTNNSALTKITNNDIDIYAQVAELKYNEITKLNKKFENNFKLKPDQYQMYQPYLFKVINQLPNDFFVKALLVDDFKINYALVKNKVFLKCYKENSLVLEINMSSSQFSSICEKYNTNIEEDLSTEIYTLIFAGTFRKENNILKSKLTNLKLIKIAYKNY